MKRNKWLWDVQIAACGRVVEMHGPHEVMRSSQSVMAGFRHNLVLNLNLTEFLVLILVTNKYLILQARTKHTKTVCSTEPDPEPKAQPPSDTLTYRQQSHQTFPLAFTDFCWSLLVCPGLVWCALQSLTGLLVRCWFWPGSGPVWGCWVFGLWLIYEMFSGREAVFLL